MKGKNGSLRTWHHCKEAFSPFILRLDWIIFGIEDADHSLKFCRLSLHMDTVCSVLHFAIVFFLG